MTSIRKLLLPSVADTRPQLHWDRQRLGRPGSTYLLVTCGGIRRLQHVRAPAPSDSVATSVTVLPGLVKEGATTSGGTRGVSLRPYPACASCATDVYSGSMAAVSDPGLGGLRCASAALIHS